MYCGVSSSRCFKGAQHLHVQGQAVQELELDSEHEGSTTLQNTVNYSLKLQKSGVFGHELRRILAAVHFVEDYWFAGPCMPKYAKAKHSTLQTAPVFVSS
jgi:hypothetical protein